MADPLRSRIPERVLRAFWVMLVTALSVYSLSVVSSNVLPTRRVIAATEQRLRRLEAENAAHQRFLDAAERECALLRSDPWTVERALRDELHMSRPGEHIVR